MELAFHDDQVDKGRNHSYEVGLPQASGQHLPPAETSNSTQVGLARHGVHEVLVHSSGEHLFRDLLVVNQ